MDAYRALIVEDDASWQENFREALEGLGITCQVSGVYQEADTQLDRRHFHLLLVDLRLNAGSQELEGMKLVQKAAALSEGTSTIIISGYADATIATEALKRYDAYYVLEKEKIDPQQFSALAQEAVAHAREAYRARYVSAIEFLRRDQELHSWTAGVLQAILGPEKRLGLRDLDRLRDLLNDLLEGLYPLLYQRTEPDALIDADAKVVRTRCWSKGLGEPILIEFGRVKPIAGPPDGVSRAERICELDDLGGAVYVLANTPFEDFESGSSQNE